MALFKDIIEKAAGAVGDLGEVDGDVVFESGLTDVGKELLEVGDVEDAVAAEGLERAVGELALAEVYCRRYCVLPAGGAGDCGGERNKGGGGTGAGIPCAC